MEAVWARAWFPGVRQWCLSGYGVAQSFWNPSDVAAVVRVPEVRRRRCGAVPARRHAFESAGFSCRFMWPRSDCFGRPISLDLELAEINASEQRRQTSCPEVPSRLLSSHPRKKVMADRLFFDDVLRLEAWALVEAVERAAHSQPVHDCRLLPLNDNLSIVLCFSP